MRALDLNFNPSPKSGVWFLQGFHRTLLQEGCHTILQATVEVKVRIGSMKGIWAMPGIWTIYIRNMDPGSQGLVEYSIPIVQFSNKTDRNRPEDQLVCSARLGSDDTEPAP